MPILFTPNQKFRRYIVEIDEEKGTLSCYQTLPEPETEPHIFPLVNGLAFTATVLAVMMAPTKDEK